MVVRETERAGGTQGEELCHSNGRSIISLALFPLFFSFSRNSPHLIRAEDAPFPLAFGPDVQLEAPPANIFPNMFWRSRSYWCSARVQTLQIGLIFISRAEGFISSINNSQRPAFLSSSLCVLLLLLLLRWWCAEPHFDEPVPYRHVYILDRFRKAPCCKKNNNKKTCRINDRRWTSLNMYL